MNGPAEQNDLDDVQLAFSLAVRVARGGPRPAAAVTEGVAALVEATGEVPGKVAREALEEVILGRRVQDALQWMQDSGLLPWVLPELSATVGFAQEIDRHHKDVWKHTKQVVDQAVDDPAVRWAALLHDVGKVPTRAVTPDGKVTFHGHAELGARMFDRIARRLEFDRERAAVVRFLVLHHQRASQYEASWTESAVRRFDRDMGEHLGRLLSLSRADITSARPHKCAAARAQLDELWQRIQTLREIDAQVPPLPSGLGNVLMEHLGLSPGPRVGAIKRALERAVEAGELDAGQEPAYYLPHADKIFQQNH